jgi:hypothetical protein
MSEGSGDEVRVPIGGRGPEPRQLHRCSFCGKVAGWDARWRWYGLCKDGGGIDPVVKLCSLACHDAAEPGFLPRRIEQGEREAWAEVSVLGDAAAFLLYEITETPDLSPGELAHLAFGVDPSHGRFRAAVKELEGAGLLEVRAGKLGRPSLRPKGKGSDRG